jgi:predicted RND superfamily exporter protein
MIILSILKIIGIVLACIVGLVLLLVLLILLVPIRYRFSGDGMNADIQADGKASWLFGFLSASIRFAEKKLLYRVSVAGISLKKGDLLNPEKIEPDETDLESQILKPQKDKKEEKEAAALEVQNKPESEAKTEIEEEK